jgi:hypothetical protein
LANSSCDPRGNDEYDLHAKAVHLGPNESHTVETVGTLKSAAKFERHERDAAGGARAALTLDAMQYFIDKPGKFQAVFVMEQPPLNTAYRTRLKMETPWSGRSVSSPATINLGEP